MTPWGQAPWKVEDLDLKGRTQLLMVEFCGVCCSFEDIENYCFYVT